MRDQEVAAQPADVDAEHTGGLCCVDQQPDTMPAAYFSDLLDRRREAVSEVDHAEADHPRSLANELPDVVHLEPVAAVVANEPDPHFQVGQVEPGQDRRRKVALVHDDLVSGSPIEAEGDQAQPLSRALQKGDVVGRAVVEARHQARGGRPNVPLSR